MMPIFCQLTKVNEKTRTLQARAASSAIDRDGERMHFKRSIPHFQKWSAEQHAATEGKSLGNVREMHLPSAVGVVKDIDFNTVDEAIDVTIKVTDDQAWRKVLSGTFSGLSIGGRYVAKWPEVAAGGRVITAYEAAPVEISLVDRPANPDCLIHAINKGFQLVKRDGTTERRAFATPPTSTTIPAHSEALNFMKTLHTSRTSPLLKQAAERAAKTEELRVAARALASAFARHDPTSPFADPSCTKDDGIAAIRKIHARGAVPLDPELLSKMQPADAPQRPKDDSVAAIKKALQMPPQSFGSTSESKPTGRYGATNDWHDQSAPSARPTMIGGFSDRNVAAGDARITVAVGSATKSNRDLAVDAIKRDLMRPKRMPLQRDDQDDDAGGRLATGDYDGDDGALGVNSDDRPSRQTRRKSRRDEE
jgi:hypothetical protein